MFTLTPVQLSKQQEQAARGTPVHRRTSPPLPLEARPSLDTASADPQARDTIAAQRAWQAHVDAGRIGVPAPPPMPGPHRDLRFAGLEAILFGARRLGGRG